MIPCTPSAVHAQKSPFIGALQNFFIYRHDDMNDFKFLK